MDPAGYHLDMKRTRVLLFAALALAVPLAACGGGSSADSTTTTAATTAETTSETTSDSSSGASTSVESMAATTTGDSTGGTTAATSDPATTPPAGGGDEIVIGAQDFGESAILAEVYGQALSNAGYSVKQQSLGGFRDLVYTSFESGKINFTAEYAASAADFLNKGSATSDIATTQTALEESLNAKDLTALDASPAIDSNSFVVTAETAAKLSAPKVSALTPDMKLGAPGDCTTNASCLPGLKATYGLDLSAGFVPLDGGGPVTVDALKSGSVDVVVLFSTNSVIAENGWVVLEDDKHLIKADNVIPVTTKALAGDATLAKVVNDVSAALTTSELTDMNKQYDVDKRDPDEIAVDWLTEKGLIGG